MDISPETLNTQDMIYVKNGSMRVLLYDENQKFLEDFILYKGDTAIFANGGHGYEILDDDTQIIESKNGHFMDQYLSDFDKNGAVGTLRPRRIDRCNFYHVRTSKWGCVGSIIME